MKIYVFETINGIVIRKAAKSIDEAIAWFKETYPTRVFSCVYEQQTQEKIKKVKTVKSIASGLIKLDKPNIIGSLLDFLLCYMQLYFIKYNNYAKILNNYT